MAIPRPGKKFFLPLAALILLVALSVGGFFYYQKRTNAKTNSSNTDVSSQVGKLIELPAESPTIATVSDVAKLANQPFFAHAQNGDKVLIYQNAKKAILYRPSTNKLIEVAAYNPSSVSPAPSQAAKNIKVAIYNGTKTAGLAKTQGTSLTAKHPNIEITSTGNAANDYTKDLIVDLTGKNAAFVKTLAGELSGEVGKLPSTETKPDADILIILGAAQ